MILGKRALEQLIDIPRFRMMTWQTLFSKFKIQTNNTRTISETFILTTAICLSLLISGIVILNALPLDENAELAEQSYIENECETIVEEFPSENSYNQVNEYNKQRGGTAGSVSLTVFSRYGQGGGACGFGGYHPCCY